MTIAILPTLVEFFTTGSVAVIAGMAGWYLFKHNKASTESTNQNNNPPQETANTSPAVNQDAPEPISASVVETVKKETAVESSSSAEEISAATVSEEPILKRHHLHNIRLMLEATTFPRPTDSALSRHYDEVMDAKAEECLENEAKMARLIADYEAIQNAQNISEPSPVPEVSTKASDEVPGSVRHHLHNVRMMVMATTFPRPTDSALSRHYDGMIDAKAEDCLANEAKMARLLADYQECEKAQPAQQNVAVKADTPANAVKSKPCIVPEDSMLKRHFLTNLQANLEKNKAPRPTDSALRRHYDAMINAEMEDYLACN